LSVRYPCTKRAGQKRWVCRAVVAPIQGFLAHKKTHPPPGLPQDSRHRPKVGSWEVAFS
jgi:hypothetical protein